MLFPHEAPLPKPAQLSAKSYAALLSEIKQYLVEHVNKSSAEDGQALAIALDNDAEILTKVIQAFVVYLQNFEQQKHEDALEMFGMYATRDDMIDVIVSRLGITRQTISEGDPLAYPPVEAVKESNHQLLTRYYLANYALSSTGTRNGYRYHAMTLGGRPSISVDSPTPKQVVVTYSFDDHEYAGMTKDAQARQVAPGTGEVDCYILQHQGDGVPSSELVQATQDYLTRDDIAQETDKLTVKPASIKTWQCVGHIYVPPGPDKSIVKQAAEAAVWAYGQQMHRLGAEIDASAVQVVIGKAVSVSKIHLTSLPAPVTCTYSEAPHLDHVELTVITSNL